MKEFVSHEAGFAHKKREVHRIRNRLIIGVIVLLIVTAALIVLLLL